MSRRFILFLCTVVVGYAVLLYAIDKDRVASPIATPGSSASAQPQGALALARLWSSLKLPFTLWANPPQVLGNAQSGVLVSVEPSSNQYAQKDARQVLRWAEEGHPVVWVTSSADAVSNSLHISVLPAEAKVIRQVATQPGKNNTGGEERFSGLQFTSAASITVGSGAHVLRLYQTESGRVIGAALTVGRGNITVWTVPQVFENAGMGRLNNFRIIWFILGNKAILWDEYGHGVESGGMLQSLFRHGRSVTLPFLAVFVVMFLWAGLTRFGTPVRDVLDIPRVGGEFLDALAYHLRRPALRPYLVSLLGRAHVRVLRLRVGTTRHALSQMISDEEVSLSTMLRRMQETAVQQSNQAPNRQSDS